MAQMPEYVIKINADDEDMAHSEDHVLAYPALVRMVYRLQDELHAYAAQVVAVKAELAELREKVKAWEADS